MAEEAKALTPGSREGCSVFGVPALSLPLTVTAPPVTLGILGTSWRTPHSPTSSQYPGPHIWSPAFPVLRGRTAGDRRGWCPFPRSAPGKVGAQVLPPGRCLCQVIDRQHHVLV